MEIECAFKFLLLDHIFKTRFSIILLDIKPPKKIDFKVYFLFPDNEAIFFQRKKKIMKVRDTPLCMILQKLNLLLTATSRYFAAN